MKHFMHLKDEPFGLIWSGKKTIELRLYDEKRRSVSVGDLIEFENDADRNKRLLARVKALHLFDSFEELYKALPLEKCGYDPESITTASPDGMSRYYSPNEQKMYGVVGIEFELIEKYES
jgi:ASC-1-like (ASCH) protein